MASYSFTIIGRLPGANDYILACRSNHHKANKLKQDAQSLIIKSANGFGIKPIKKPVFVEFKWFEKNERRDLDNVAFAKKFILDALTECGILQGDGWNYVIGFNDEFTVDKNHPRIIVILNEIE
jgi:Holliday junction resolvase RusA-like endonuclease